MAIKLHRDLAANVLNGLIIILLVIGAIVFWGQHQFQTEGPTPAPVIVEINPNDKLITTSPAPLAWRIGWQSRVSFAIRGFFGWGRGIYAWNRI